MGGSFCISIISSLTVIQEEGRVWIPFPSWHSVRANIWLRLKYNTAVQGHLLGLLPEPYREGADGTTDWWKPAHEWLVVWASPGFTHFSWIQEATQKQFVRESWLLLPFPFSSFPGRCLWEEQASTLCRTLGVMCEEKHVYPFEVLSENDAKSWGKTVQRMIPLFFKIKFNPFS